jgi:hypothetical protein
LASEIQQEVALRKDGTNIEDPYWLKAGSSSVTINEGMLDFLILRPFRVLGSTWENSIESLDQRAWDDIAIAYCLATEQFSTVLALRENFMVCFLHLNKIWH